MGSGEAEYSQPQQCLPDKINELVTNVLMTTEANYCDYAEAMVKLSAREDGTVPTNNGENVYDSSKSICEFNNHSIRTMKEKVNNFS